MSIYGTIAIINRKKHNPFSQGKVQTRQILTFNYTLFVINPHVSWFAAIHFILTLSDYSSLTDYLMSCFLNHVHYMHQLC